MVVDIEKKGNLVLVKPRGDLKAKTVESLMKALDTLQKQGAQRVALDLSKIKFIDSNAIGLIINFDKKQKSLHGFFCIYNYCDDVKELLDMIEIGDFIPLYKTYDEMSSACLVPKG